ncbi:MAG: ferritin family protein [candidate division Zixibacteria bacterium]|nr:ferritin family protein [candidate division Zixibacteria bacterium]MBU1470433.1 ferritin family protein [candidate division Zixibacteria bacterium]MBU2625813.1 ferritin family protein [candidate division Zixibacteria bacterium]
MSSVEKSVLDGLSRGIQAELSAYVFYKKALDNTRDKKVKEILSWLAGEEREHYRLLERQYDNLVRSELWVAYNDIMLKEGLPDIDERTDEIHDELIDEVDENMTAKRILEIGLILETRARDLYTELGKQVTDPKGKETYAYLVRFETGHIAKIETMMKDLGLV